MNDYSAWRSRVLRGPARPSPFRDSSSEASTQRAPPPPPPPLPSAFHSPPSHLSSSPAAATTSAKMDCQDNADITSRLSDVLHDIAATEHGHERTWLNVQPCVLHTIKLLAVAARAQTSQLRLLEDTVQQTQECLSVLLRDREVKEERYRLDTAAHKAETEQLWKRVLSLEAQQQQQQKQPFTSLLPSSALLDNRVNNFEQRLRDVQRQLQSMSKFLPQRKAKSSKKSLSLLSSSSPSCSSTDALATDANRKARTGLSFSPSPEETGRSSAHSPVTQRMLEEVQRLRQQWQHFLETVPSTTERNEQEGGRGVHNESTGPSYRRQVDKGDPLPHNDNKNNHPCTTFTRKENEFLVRRKRVQPRKNSEDSLSDTEIYADDWRDDGGDRLLHDQSSKTHFIGNHTSSHFLLPSSGRRMRWYWAGDAHNSGFLASPNVSPRRSSAPWGPQRGSNFTVPWAEWHAFDGRTDCWYSLGSWATHKQELAALRQNGEVHGETSCSPQPKNQNAQFGWMVRTSGLVSWPYPTHLQVERGGIYEVRLCLVWHGSSCAASTSKSGQQVAVEKGVLSLWVDGAAVTGLQENVSHLSLYARRSPSVSPLTRNRRSSRSPPHLDSRGRIQEKLTSRSFTCNLHDDKECGDLLPRHARMEEAYRGSQRQKCCEPVQVHTHSVVTCLYLPARVTLQVRCSELLGSKAVQEAFCELTYLI